MFHMGNAGALLFSAFWLALGVHIAVRRELRSRVWLAAAGVGLIVAAA